MAALDGSASRPLTAWPDPHPQLTRISKRLITLDRGDGVTLSGMLYLPPGHDPAAGARLPLVIWAYPLDYGTADTAGQVRAGNFEFTRLTALGPAVLALGGYAVLADATMERSKARRRGRLYFDCYQNGWGKTMVAPYSLRAVDGAQVSAPLRWREVTARLDPAAFHLHNMSKRLARVGDLWADTMTRGVRLPRLR